MKASTMSKAAAGLLLAGLMVGLGLSPSLLARAAPSALPSAPSLPPSAEVSYERWFTDQALRVDVFHTGTAKENLYGLDEIVLESKWPGTRRYLLDPFHYGTYQVRVLDKESGQEIFRQGYATLFDEWTGTDEAVAGVRRSMSESVRFPCPRKSVILTLDRRQKDGTFQEQFRLPIDPNSHLISHAQPYTIHDLGQIRPISDKIVVDLSGGPPPEKALDVLIVPEGYSWDDREKLQADLRRFTDIFLSHEPWASNRARIHVRGISITSRESGVTEPRKGVFVDTLLGASFNTFDSPRYLTVLHTKTLRQVAALAPYDTLFVMVNSSRYGGGGIYNQWSIFTSDNEYDDYLLLHEYGHHMGALGDEYYNSAVATDEDAMYPPGVEPWEPNITAFLGRERDHIKWNSLISPQTPVPTPPEKAYAGVVGAFEGAGYKAKGLFRPQLDCKMLHKGQVEFCQVCRKSLESMIRYYTGEELLP